MSERRQWSSIAEAGSMAAMHLMAAIHRVAGRRVASAMLYPISAYFCWARPATTTATLDYLRTLRRWSGGAVPSHPPERRDGLGQIHSFSINLYDRMIAWGGGASSFVFEHEGGEHLKRLADSGRGGILLGAHIGSFDMARILASQYDVPINVLMFTEHAERITSFFERLDPASRLRVLRLDPSTAQAGFAIKACLERGEFVGILADRIPPGSREQVEIVDFLGRAARFPLSPYLLACTLGAPLLTSMCVRTGDSSYRAVVEVLSEGEVVPRRQRRVRARELLEKYVATLEDYCRQWPLQWFNFYDYWGDDECGGGELAAPAGESDGPER